MFKRNKIKETKNEVMIRLLPEKAKNDYLLRMVSMIIIMIFIIINFFTIFLPRINRISSVNALKRDNYVLQNELNNISSQYNHLPRNYFDISKNNDYLAINEGQLEVQAIVNDIRELLVDYQYSFLENIDYNTSTQKLVINVQFIIRDEVDEFNLHLTTIDYVKSSNVRSHIQSNFGDGLPRQKVIYELVLDAALAPKVGESND